MVRLAALVGALLLLSCAAQAQPTTAACRPDTTTLRDAFWQHQQPPHPLLGKVYKDGKPIAVDTAACVRSPLQQLIVELWRTVRGDGIALLGEIHDNPEHHRVRGDILWPRLDRPIDTARLHPAAVFEHIRTSQQPGLDSFYDQAARSRRLWRAADLLREIGWESSGWPPGKMFEPLFDGALWAKLRIYPGNAPRERIRAMGRAEEAGLSASEKAHLDLARTLPQPLQDALAKELEASHCGVLPPTAFAPMSLAQRATDAHLATALLEAAEKEGGAFLLAGNGHVRTDRGVPWYLRKLAPNRRVQSVMLLEVEEGREDPAAYVPSAPDGAWAADYVLFTPRQARPDPCAAMRRQRP